MLKVILIDPARQQISETRGRQSKRPLSSAETSNPAKRVIDEPSTVRVTERYRPDRGTIGRSSANCDYQISTYDRANQAKLLQGRFLLGQ